MATDQPTNTRSASQLTAAELTALCGRLRAHADKLESIIARPLVDDLLLASRAIGQLTQPIEITIDLRGGTIDEVRGVPAGTTITVRDYDTEGSAETDQDDQGEPCFISRWPDAAAAEGR